MGTCKLVPQTRRSRNLHGTETIVTVKFRGLGHTINGFKQLKIKISQLNYAIEKGMIKMFQEPGDVRILATPLGSPGPLVDIAVLFRLF